MLNPASGISPPSPDDRTGISVHHKYCVDTPAAHQQVARPETAIPPAGRRLGQDLAGVDVGPIAKGVLGQIRLTKPQLAGVLLGIPGPDDIVRRSCFEYAVAEEFATRQDRCCNTIAPGDDVGIAAGPPGRRAKS